MTEAAYAVVALPLRLRLRHTTADTGELTVVFLRIRCADGHVGWAETRGNGEYATHHTAASITAALAALPPATDAAWDDPAALADALAGHCPPAAMLVDIAWRDALARSSGVPLWVALGGVRRAAGPRLATHAPIGFGDPEQAATAATAAAEAGFGRVKVRVGGDPALDRARVARIRQAVDAVAGAGAVAIAADANGGWDAATGTAATHWLAGYGVAWFEQPTPAADLTALARVRATSPIPIWADEAVRDSASVHAVADAGAADGVHLKLEKAGTVATLSAAVDAARRRGLDVGLGQMDCGRLGCATTAHLAAALDVQVAELWGCANVERDVAEGLELRDGAVLLPDAPGLGVHVALHPTALTPVGARHRAPVPAVPKQPRTCTP
ncbi:mandelate racemase/muconate lactonizing protein [Streptomyces malaysiensis]|uniref:Mandelate racemase/muconate lactonizing protein n=1 Tax=Streptomyces malaysiensis TaxID=92644 RepID=A0A7X6B0R6_STRMQ|nr:mandelate racemase/muconate lactonizing protein [Streptomyces malaysiensis]